jgi:glutamine synthetase
VKNKVEPPDPIDKDLYDLPPEEAAQVKQVPGSLEEVLDALENDHQFLLEGGVFTQDVIDTYIEFKRKNELDEVRLRPHPYEFALYSDI